MSRTLRSGVYSALFATCLAASTIFFSNYSFAQEKPTADTATLSATSTANLSSGVKVLTMANAPDVAACRGMLDQKIVDLANNSAEDPAVVYERNRRLHPHMIMIPPPLECASGLWRAARGAAPAVDLQSVTERQYAPESVFQFSPFAASVGANVDPAGGTEGYQGETSISIDPNNPLHMVGFSNTFYKDPNCVSPTGGAANTYGTMSLYASTDGGATWTYNCAPWPATVTGGVASAAYWFGSDPALAWDNQGRPYATYMLISQSAAGASGAAIVTARSSDNGATWQSLGTVVNGIASTTQGNDKEMMAIDNTSGQAFSHPGRIYVIWDAANAEKIAYSDNGSTWTTVNFASNTGAIGGNVVVGADGTVYCIWNRYNVETIVFSKSTDGGATWTAPAVISTMALQSFGSNNLPAAQDQRGINAFGAIDIDRNPNSAYFGTLYVSFPDFPAGTTSGADINTYVIRSTNGGAAWSSRVKVNDDNFGASQFFPWLAVDQSDGTVNVSWLDTRLDPLNRKTQAVYARSSNGGVSFEPNILVTDGGVNWRNNANYSDENSTDNTTYNGNQYGDYTGIAALNRQVHPLWTDSRSFFPLADTTSPTRREDNATATIVNCSVPAAISAPSVNPSTAPNVAVTWSAPTAWGTNATGGTYTVYRNTTPTLVGATQVAIGLTSTSFVDGTGATGTTYYYFVAGRNNCSGTALTPMTSTSPASSAVVFGNAGTPVGILQGTVKAGGSPVAGVTVNANALGAITDSNGFYQFPAVDAGSYTVSVNAAGYAPYSANGVNVTSGSTTTQNIVLTATSGANCLTDTTFGDFSAGVGAGVDIASSPGDLKLSVAGGQQADLTVTDSSTSGNAMTSTTWWGQSFVPTISGPLTKISVQLFCSGCTGTTSPIVINVHATSGGLPTGAALATATIPAFSSGSGILYSATFASPTTVTAGTTYAFTVHAQNTISAGTYAVTRTATNLYGSGQSLLSSNSGSSWAAPTGASKDLEFQTFVTTPLTYPNPGSFTSAVKDSGSVAGSTTNWTTLSWTATTPANTSIKFQAAGSNDPNGPFTFVGPDGTAATFFTTSGASLSQFNGFRYLKYKALLATTDTSATPTLNDVTICDSVAAIPAPQTLTVAKAGNGTGTVVSSPAGISCGASCIADFANSTLVTLTATEDAGSTFTGWSGDCSGIGTCNVTMSLARSVTATFTQATPTVQFSSAAFTGDESRNAVITVTRSGDLSGTASVQADTVAGGTATVGTCGSGADYQAVSTLVSFAATEGTKTFTVPLCGDATIDPSETVALALSAPANSTLGSPSTAVLTINDTASAFTNQNQIDLVTGLPGSLYPSDVTVSGIPNASASMRVTLYGVSHVKPDNIDVMLVGPNGNAYMLMSDAGGLNAIDPAAPVTLTFTDSAAQVLPDSSLLTTGTFLPTTWEANSTPFGSPAPTVFNQPGSATSGRTSLQTLQGNFGGNPNGTWHLYVRDDNATAIASGPAAVTGSIGGWGLQFFAPTAAHVSISGRVADANGYGLRNAVVQATDASGHVVTARTNAFGYYSFDNLTAGESYLLTPSAKGQHFTSRMVQLSDQIADMDFRADD